MQQKQSYSFIFEFLVTNDSEFVPNLSKTVNLRKYAKKISDFARHFVIKNEECIEGFAAVYLNDFESKIAYLSYICIKKGHQGKGLGMVMLNDIIISCKKEKFKELRLEVAKQNFSAISFYEKNQFKIIEENNTSFFMKKEF